MSVLTEKLIVHVKKHKILYDLAHPEYKNIKKKNKVWDEIGVSFNTDGDSIKKKWKNLRDCYAKHLRTEVITHNGQDRKYVDRYKTWPWSNQMEIFKPFLQFAQTASNVSAPNNEITLISEENSENGDATNDYIVSQNEINLPEHHVENISRENISVLQTSRMITSVPDTPRSNVTTTRRRRLEQRTSTPSAVDKVIEYLEQKPFSNTQVEYDDIDLICLGYAKTLKKFSPRRQILTKFKIAQLLMEEEPNQQMQDTSSETAHSSVPSTSSTQSNTTINSPVSELPHTLLSNDSIDNDQNTTITTWYEQFSQTQL